MSRLLAWITSILLLFVVLEAIVRLATTAPPTEPDARLGWVYKQNTHQTRSIAGGGTFDFVTNSARLRAPEGHGTGPKKPGETRVLFVGDSFTMGWALEADATFAARVEEISGKAGQLVTCIPAGTESYYTDQECLWLEDHVAEYQPDVVVLCPFANDVTGNALPKYLATNKPLFEIGPNGEIARTPAPVSDARPFYLKMSRLLSQINSIRLAMGSRVAVPAEAGGGKLQLDDFAFLAKDTEISKKGWTATAAIAKRLVEKARAGGARHVFVAPIPNKFEVHHEDGLSFELASGTAPGSLDFGKVTTRLGEVFASAGATLVDARPALFRAAAAGRVYYESPGEWHFNEAGALTFAQAIYDSLNKAGAIPPGSGAPLPQPRGLALGAVQHREGGVPTWVFVVAGIWVVLSIGFKVAYPDENPALAFAKVGLLLSVVVALFLGIGWLTAHVSPSIKVLLFVAVFVGIGSYALYKTAPRLGTIRELFGALVDRGHWYLVPMLVVMLTISILLVVAQNPIVAPFIYTLF